VDPVLLADVMVTEQGEPIIMDFGLARREAPQDPRLSRSGFILGTPAYLPPEQVGGRPEALGPPGDIYTLGVMFYQLLTGQVPFLGPAHEILRQVLTEEPPPPSARQPGLDPRLDQITRRAMAKDPQDRFGSMAEFAAALEDWLRPESQPAPPSQPGPPPPVSGRRLSRRAAVAIAIATAVPSALLALVLAWPWPWQRRLRGPSRTDPLPVGSRWSGQFRFRPPLTRADGQAYISDVQLEIQRREGPIFWGVYTTEAGRYQWRIEGTLQDQAIRWTFTEAIRDNEYHNVIGQATIAGKLRGEWMEVVFQNAGGTADIGLALTHPR
jgi:serine/threonine protein kinase